VKSDLHFNKKSSINSKGGIFQISCFIFRQENEWRGAQGTNTTLTVTKPDAAYLSVKRFCSPSLQLDGLKAPNEWKYMKKRNLFIPKDIIFQLPYQ